MREPLQARRTAKHEDLDPVHASTPEPVHPRRPRLACVNHIGGGTPTNPVNRLSPTPLHNFSRFPFKTLSTNYFISKEPTWKN